MNYINLFKERSFIIIATYFITVNIIVDYKTPKIVIFVNLTKKILKIVKKVRLNIIYKYIDVIYIIIDILRVLIILATIAATVSAIDLFISV